MRAASCRSPHGALKEVESKTKGFLIPREMKGLQMSERNAGDFRRENFRVPESDDPGFQRLIERMRSFTRLTNDAIRRENFPAPLP